MNSPIELLKAQDLNYQPFFKSYQLSKESKRDELLGFLTTTFPTSAIPDDGLEPFDQLMQDDDNAEALAEQMIIGLPDQSLTEKNGRTTQTIIKVITLKLLARLKGFQNQLENEQNPKERDIILGRMTYVNSLISSLSVNQEGTGLLSKINGVIAGLS